MFIFQYSNHKLGNHFLRRYNSFNLQFCASSEVLMCSSQHAVKPLRS